MHLYFSFLGVGWAAQHAQSLGILENADDLCDAVDEATLEGLDIHADSMLWELLDEPTVNLDASSIRRLVESSLFAGRTVLYAGHDSQLMPAQPHTRPRSADAGAV